MSTLISLQPFLPPQLPTVVGNADYLQWRQELELIDRLLRTSGAEARLVERRLQQWLDQCPAGHPPTAQAQRSFVQQSILALRCTVLGQLTGLGFRPLSHRLADSPLMQWFCGLGRMDRIRVPAKSSLQRFQHWFDEKDLRELIEWLLVEVSARPLDFGLEEPLDLEGCFLDGTCVKAPIHFPVDWVLLRDGVRSLARTIACARKHGLRHRMESPEKFIERINKLSMEMSQGRRRPDSKKHRKRVLRQMKKVVKTMIAHGKRYRELIARHWPESDWSRGHAEQAIKRLDRVLEGLPKARKQAHDRIIGQRQVPNEEKLLSLYETEAKVVVRGKAGAEVEFGNVLLLGENPQGLIVDWMFYEEVPGEAGLVRPSVERMEAAYGRKLQMLGADRGFDSAANRRFLEERGIYNGICPKNPAQLAERKAGEEVFAACQRRRAQTEGRIGIFKNQFLGRPLRVKGFEHRKQAVTWAVLAHNLWRLARMSLEAGKRQESVDYLEAAA